MRRYFRAEMSRHKGVASLFALIFALGMLASGCVATPSVSPATPIPTAVSTRPPESASFSVSNLSIVPENVQRGRPVIVSVTVTNIGGSVGSHTLALEVENDLIDEKTIALKGGSSREVNFKVTKTQKAGTYPVNVNGLGGSYTVTPPPTFPEEMKVRFGSRGPFNEVIPCSDAAEVQKCQYAEILYLRHVNDGLYEIYQTEGSNGLFENVTGQWPFFTLPTYTVRDREGFKRDYTKGQIVEVKTNARTGRYFEARITFDDGTKITIEALEGMPWGELESFRLNVPGKGYLDLEWNRTFVLEVEILD